MESLRTCIRISLLGATVLVSAPSFAAPPAGPSGKATYSVGPVSVDIVSNGANSTAAIKVGGATNIALSGACLQNPGFSVNCDATTSIHTYSVPGSSPVVDCFFEECSIPVNKGIFWCETRTAPSTVVIPPVDMNK